MTLPTRLTTVTRQTGKYKVDLTRHPKFPLVFGELARGRFPHVVPGEIHGPVTSH
jgi:hypothetical protein